MEDRNLLYVGALAIAIALSLAIAGYAIANENRRRKLRWLLAAMMIVTAIWSTSSAMTHLTTDSATTLEWHAMAAVPTFVLPVIWLLFALEFAGYDRIVTKRTIGVLSIVPGIALVGMVTNHSHGWYLSAVSVSDGGAYVEHTQGWLYEAYLAYAYLLILVGMVVLVHVAYTSRRIYRAQAVAITVAVAVPLVVNVGYTSGIVPSPLNFTPVAFAVSGVAIAGAVFRYRLLDLIPVARENLIETMRDGFVVLDDDDRVVDVNEAGRKLLIGDENPIGRSAETVTIGGYDLSTVLDDGMEEVTVERFDDVRYVRVRSTNLAEGNEEGRSGTMVLFQDVTERRHTERRFKQFIEHATDVVTVLEEDGTIRYQSPSIRRVLGYEPDAMIDECAFEYVHPDDRERVVERFHRGSNGEVVHIEFRMRHADGGWRVLDANGRYLLDDPVIEGVVVNSRDVTERREHERDLERTNKRLDEFASVVSHDLRNPLNVSEGYLELLAERVDDDTLDVVREQNRRMRSIIDDALTLAREGATIEETTSVSLASTARLGWANVDTAGGSLTIDGDRIVESDRNRLLRIFENLFRNSIEHGTDADTTRPSENAHGGSDVSIHVGPTECGFYVADDGPGIPSEKRDRVFESGYSSSVEGTGFGLAIVDEIAAAHGWSVAITDDVDAPVDGACFAFDLTGDREAIDEDRPRVSIETSDV